MARPSKTVANLGTVVYNGKLRKVLVVWRPYYKSYLLYLKSHGRGGHMIASGQSIADLKKRVDSFRLVQA